VVARKVRLIAGELHLIVVAREVRLIAGELHLIVGAREVRLIAGELHLIVVDTEPHCATRTKCFVRRHAQGRDVHSTRCLGFI